MKKILIIIAASLAFLFISGAVGGYVWGDLYIKKCINIAKEKYPDKVRAEDALIAYMLDTSNSLRDRSHLAIWSLGQIQSEKARPILWKLYKNDPKGNTCFGKHNKVLCQYEIYKALHAKEVNWWPLHPYLNR